MVVLLVNTEDHRWHLPKDQGHFSECPVDAGKQLHVHALAPYTQPPVFSYLEMLPLKRNYLAYERAVCI